MLFKGPQVTKVQLKLQIVIAAQLLISNKKFSGACSFTSEKIRFQSNITLVKWILKYADIIRNH